MSENNIPENVLADIDAKKELKQTINQLIAGLFLYQLILPIAIGIFALPISALLNSLFFHGKDIIDINGYELMLMILIGLPFLMWFYGALNYKDSLFLKNKKMSSKAFMILFCVFMSAQGINLLLSIGVESGLHIFGFSLQNEINSARSVSTTVPILLCASFLGPVSEEIIFRGLLLKNLSKYGKLFAIIISALLFGVYHGNLLQGVFAFQIGLVLGYVSLEYSLKWSILLHIINNFVFGQLLACLISGLNANEQYIISVSVNMLFLIAAIIILCYHKHEIRSYLNNNKTPKGLYKFTFTLIWMIVFLAFYLIAGIGGIEKL